RAEARRRSLRAASPDVWNGDAVVTVGAGEYELRRRVATARPDDVLPVPGVDGRDVQSATGRREQPRPHRPQIEGRDASPAIVRVDVDDRFTRRAPRRRERRARRRKRALVRSVAVDDLELRSIDEGNPRRRNAAGTGDPALDLVAD